MKSNFIKHILVVWAIILFNVTHGSEENTEGLELQKNRLEKDKNGIRDEHQNLNGTDEESKPQCEICLEDFCLQDFSEPFCKQHIQIEFKILEKYDWHSEHSKNYCLFCINQLEKCPICRYTIEKHLFGIEEEDTLGYLHGLGNWIRGLPLLITTQIGLIAEFESGMILLNLYAIVPEKFRYKLPIAMSFSFLIGIVIVIELHELLFNPMSLIYLNSLMILATTRMVRRYKYGNNEHSPRCFYIAQGFSFLNGITALGQSAPFNFISSITGLLNDFKMFKFSKQFANESTIWDYAMMLTVNIMLIFNNTGEYDDLTETWQLVSSIILVTRLIMNVFKWAMSDENSFGAEPKVKGYWWTPITSKPRLDSGSVPPIDMKR